MLVGLALASASRPAVAQYTDYRLLRPDRRMAQTASPFGSRLWAVTRGGYVAGRAVEESSDAWQLYYTGNAHSDVAAVSFLRSGSWRERIFSTRRAGSSWYLDVIRIDGGAYQGRASSPATSVDLREAALAATVRQTGASFQITVAATSGDGRVCLWRWYDGGSIPAPVCSPSGVVVTGRAAALATPSTSVEGSSWFYYVKGSGALERARLVITPFGSWVYRQNLGLPPGFAATDTMGSLDAVEGDGGTHWVAVGSSDGRLFVAEVRPDGSVSWHPLPLPPGNPTLAGTQRTTLALTRWQTLDFQTYQTLRLLTVYATSAGGAVLSATSGDGPDLARWSWSAPFDPRPELKWLGTGLATSESWGWAGLWSRPVLWGQAGSEQASWLSGATTLTRFTGSKLDDFLYSTQRPWVADVAVGRDAADPLWPSASYQPATEGNVAVGGTFGLATGIERRFPWKVWLAWSGVGGASFSDGLQVQPSEAWLQQQPVPTVAMSDPFVAYDPASGRFHFIAIETALTGDDANCTVSGSVQAIVYRSAFSAPDLAAVAPVPVFDVTDPRTFDCDGNGGACVVGSPSHPLLLSQADHGALVLAPGGSGFGVPATPHVVLWDGASGVYHWWKPEGLPPRIVRIEGDPQGPPSERGLPPNPPSAFVDAAGDLYAYTFPVFRDATTNVYPVLCRIDPDGSASGQPGRCDPNAVGRLAPSGSAPQAAAPRYTWINSGVYYTFQTEEPFSFAAHPTVPGRLYAVFHGWPHGRMSGPTRVYFVKHFEGDMMDQWAPAVEVAPSVPPDPSGQTEWAFFDPELSVADDRSIAVTFYGAQVWRGTTTLYEDRVYAFVAVSTDEGASFRIEQYPAAELSWQPSHLPRHCSRPGRPRFLGEYRRPVALGGRHLHLLHRSAGGSPVHYTVRFVSPWAPLP